MSAICKVTLDDKGAGSPANWTPSGATNPTSDGFVTLTMNSSTGDVLSVQPDGTWQTRVKGTDGPWEKAGLNGNVLTYCPDGKVVYAYLFMASVPNV